MSYADFLAFTQAPDPGFVCFAAGGENADRGKFIARVRHELGEPANSESLKGIERALHRHGEQLIPFFRKHDGFTLYQDTLSEAAGIDLYPFGVWEEATDRMRQSLAFFKQFGSEIHKSILRGVAIASVRHSDNYFVMPVDGPIAGKIVYGSHDGDVGSDALAFEDFLLYVINEPAHLLNDELGCYTRYADGKTDVQWVPERYYPDIKAAPATST